MSQKHSAFDYILKTIFYLRAGITEAHHPSKPSKFYQQFHCYTIHFISKCIQFLLPVTSAWLCISVLYNNNVVANWNSTCVFSLHKLSLDCPFGAEGLSWHVPVGGSDQFVIPSPLCVLPALRWWPCSDPGGTLGQGQVFHTHHTGTKELVPADPCLRGTGTEEQALQNFFSIHVKSSVTRICVTRYSSLWMELRLQCAFGLGLKNVNRCLDALNSWTF